MRKFKKGDKIKFIHLNEINNWKGPHLRYDFKLNTEYTIDELGEFNFQLSSDYCVSLEGVDSGWIPEDVLDFSNKILNYEIY